jgi:uncharacterized LabA/DUF88 family protein
MPPSVVVFVDYENVIRSAHELWCEETDRLYDSLVDPLKVAELIVKRRAPGGVLQQVRVYRGRPNPRKERTSASYNDKQKMAWEAGDNRVHVFRRMLRYPDKWPAQPAQEKGIDVQLAIDVVRMAIAGEFEVGVVFSRDTDLLPALEAVRELGGAHVETAAWAGTSQLRLEDGKPLWVHKLSQDDWVATRDTRSYHVLGDGSVPRIRPKHTR